MLVMTTNDKGIAKDIDKLGRKLAKKTDEDKVAIAKNLMKIWVPRKKNGQ